MAEASGCPARTAAPITAPETSLPPLTAPLARFLGTEHVGPTAVAVIEMNPVFAGEDGRLVLATELRVTVPLSRVPAAMATESRPGPPVSQSQLARLDELARAVVANPGHVPTHAGATMGLQGLWDYVVISDDTTWNAATKTPVAPITPSVVGAFDAFAAWKNSLGMRTRVVKVRDIVQSGAGVGLGVDFASGARPPGDDSPLPPVGPHQLGNRVRPPRR